MRVELPSDWHKRALVRAVPGAEWDAEERVWAVDEPTDEAIGVMLQLFPALSAEYPTLRPPDPPDTRPFDNATPFNQRLIAPRLESDGTKLYPYQRIDLGYIAEVLKEHGGAYLGWDRGMGKTLGALGLIEALGSERTLIVCPNSAKGPVWEREIRKLRPDLRLAVMPNTKKGREFVVKRWQKYPDDIMLVHYEALALVDWGRLGMWDLMICDEVHRLRNPAAKMTKAAKRIKAHNRLGLSGSIIMNSAEELASQLQWLFPQVYRSLWRDWHLRYLNYVEGGYGRVCIGVKPEKLEAMRKELGVFMVVRTKEDELNLPRFTEEKLMVKMHTEQQRAYDGLAEEFYARLDDGTEITAADTLAQLLRLRQVATALPDHGGSAKLDLAVDLIKDTRDAVVVFSWFKAPLTELAERLERAGIPAFHVDGDMPQAKRTVAIAEFMAGERRVFLGTISTLGESVNLQRANQAIFLDRSWNPGENIQAQDRIYRIGQGRSVHVTHLVAPDTVDELRVLPVLANKSAIRRSILGRA